MEENEISDVALLDGASYAGFRQIPGWVDGGGLQGFQGCESRLDKQAQFFMQA